MTLRSQHINEEALLSKVSSFLNRWAEQVLGPMLQARVERLEAAFEKYSLSLKRRISTLPNTGSTQTPNNEDQPMTTTILTQKEYRESLMEKQNAPAHLALASVIGGDQKLKLHVWSDQQLGLIPTEDLARLAYEQSETLRQEFNRCETFLAYWRSARAGQVRTVGR